MNQSCISGYSTKDLTTTVRLWLLISRVFQKKTLRKTSPCSSAEKEIFLGVIGVPEPAGIKRAKQEIYPGKVAK